MELVNREVTVGYEQMSAGMSWPSNSSKSPPEEILKQIVPAELELVTSYEMVGHIAHMNLRDEILPYKHIIGQVILDVSYISRNIWVLTSSPEK